MMRDSSSVKLTWSLARGPATGAFGSRPRAFFPVAFSVSRRRLSFSSYSACSAS